MSQKEPKKAEALRREDLPQPQGTRNFFTGPEAAKLITDFTGEACEAEHLKELALSSIGIPVTPNIRLTERCLLPLALPVEETSKALSAAQLKAYETGPKHDQTIELDGERYLLRGLRDPLLLTPSNWVWPVDAFTPLKLGEGELSTLLTNCIVNPRPIGANELAEHPTSTAPIVLGFETEAQNLLDGWGWGAEFLDDSVKDELEQIIETYELYDPPIHRLRPEPLRLIKPESLGSAQLEVGYTFDQISYMTCRSNDKFFWGKDEKTPTQELGTKSLNVWQDFMRRVVHAELGDKFNPNNKQETVRILINRLERLEKEGSIKPRSNFPSPKWIIKNLF